MIKLNKLFESEFFRNSIRMGFGVVLSQFLNLLFIPLFSRIFAHDAYAIQGNFLSYLNIFFVFCSLGLSSSLAIAKSEEERKKILKTILAFSFIVSVLVGVVILIAYGFLSIDLGFLVFKTNSIFFLSILPLGLFSRSAMFVYETELALLGKFKLLSFSKVGLAASYGLATFFFYYLTEDSLNSLIIGNLVSFILLAGYMFKIRPVNFFQIELKWLKQLFKRYKGFVFYSLPNMLLNAVSTSIPLILLLHYYGDYIAGNYAMALKIVAIPVSFIASSLRVVYLKKISEIYKQKRNKLYEVVKKIFLFSQVASFFIFLGIFIFSPWITNFFLGIEWSDTYLYIQLLCPWYFLLISNSPLAIIFDILERQKHNFIREVGLLIFRAGAIVACFYLGYDGVSAVTTIVVVSVVFNLILSGMILGFCKKASIQPIIN